MTECTERRKPLVESDYMPLIRETFRVRCSALGLKKKAREKESAAYLQGVLAALTAAGIMDMCRAGQIGFMVTIGRGAEFLEERE